MNKKKIHLSFYYHLDNRGTVQQKMSPFPRFSVDRYRHDRDVCNKHSYPQQTQICYRFTKPVRGGL